MARSDQDTPTYSIGAVSRLTGLTTHTLRMWEHRYKAVVAAREANGRRSYSPADVEKLSLLKAFTDRGIRISSIAGLDVAALRKRAEQDHSLESPQATQPVRVAVMGASLAGKLREITPSDDQIVLAVSASEPAELKSDLSINIADVLVMEWPVLDQHTVQVIRETTAQLGLRHTIVVYRFGRSQEIKALMSEGMTLLQSPVNSSELRTAVLTAPRGGKTAAIETAQQRKGQKPASLLTNDDPVPARRFNAQQLARLSRVESSIDCECPRHMAEILSSLGAFELYSQQCEDRDDKDAALHAFLHASTARARAIMEDALVRLSEDEELNL